jgi:aldehyde dehydrogenase (NAD+)
MPPTATASTKNRVSLADIPAVVARAREAFDSGRTRPLEWRRRQLDALIGLLERHEEELLQALHADLGRPRLEGWFADIGPIRGDVAYIRDRLAKWAGPRRVRLPLAARPGTAEIVPEPLGVVLIIGPWNYPVQLIVEPLAAALAAGNAAVVKPSELAPATSELLGRLLRQYLDADAVAVVEGGPEESSRLLEERFDHIFFTGSGRIAQLIMHAAAKHLTPVTLELGGKSPVYVHSSAKLENAARRIAWGKFFNAGQTCVAPDYALVDRPLVERLVDKIQLACQDFYGLAPIDSPDFGRIVNDAHLERLETLLRDVEPAFGGHIDRAQRYLSPTVVVDPPADSRLLEEEIFGPVLPVVPVDGLEHAIREINSRPKPLALYVFSTDDAVTDTVLERTSSGGACVNHCMLQAAPPCLPFGGVGPSGMGRYHGQAGFDTFSNMRSVLRKPAGLENDLLYPPYTKRQERLLRMAL